MVKVPTRLNPDAILDLIITDMSNYYNEPPVINDERNGKPSDHLVVLMEPKSKILEIQPRIYENDQFRPITDSGMELYGNWLSDQTWNTIFAEQDCNKKAV